MGARMARFTIDGRAFTGSQLRISDRGHVTIDGIKQEGTLYGRVEIHVLEGIIADLQVEGDLHCGVVQGDVEVRGNLTCGDVTGDVDAGGNVTCGNVGGDVDAGGNVSCGAAGGDVDAGGNVTCGQVEGDVEAGGDVIINRPA